MTENLNTQINDISDLKSTMQLDIVSAEKSIFSGRTKMVIISGHEGDLGIMPGHTQLLATLKPGEVRYVTPEGQEESLYVSGGMVEVQPEVVTILADTVLRASEIDAGRAEEAKKIAEQTLAQKGQAADEYALALIELAKAIAQLRVLRKQSNIRK